MHCERNVNEVFDERERRHEEKQNGSRIRLAPTKLQNYPRTGQKSYQVIVMEPPYLSAKEKGVGPTVSCCRETEAPASGCTTLYHETTVTCTCL